MTEQGLTLTRMPKHYPFQAAQEVPCLPPTTISTTEQESYSCHGHQSKTQHEQGGRGWWQGRAGWGGVGWGGVGWGKHMATPAIHSHQPHLVCTGEPALSNHHQSGG